MRELPLTPMRKLWLDALTKSERPVAWARMPRKPGTARNTRRGRDIAVSNTTWRPMIDAGWISGRYSVDWRTGGDWYFEITDLGRKVLKDAHLTNGADAATL